MRKAVELWQVLIAAIMMLLGMWGTASMYTARIEEKATQSATSIENHEQRIKQLEADRSELKQDIKDVKQGNQQILILLQNKQDRK